MTIENILPYKRFIDQADWKDESTYDETKIVNLVGFSFYVGEIRLLNSQDGFHSVIGISPIEDYNVYGLIPLGDVLHDYVMNLFSTYTWDELEDLNKTFKTMLQYFDIPTDKESYKETISVYTKSAYYTHIESGMML